MRQCKAYNLNVSYIQRFPFWWTNLTSLMFTGGFTSWNWIHACKWSIQWLKPSLECVWDASFGGAVRGWLVVYLSHLQGGFLKNITHSIHVWYGISTYIYPYKSTINVGRYTVRPMDGMGRWPSTPYTIPHELSHLWSVSVLTQTDPLSLLMSHCNV